MQDPIQGFTIPLPSEVPGYQEALQAGMVPSVPINAPSALPRTTAAKFIQRRATVFVLAFVFAVILGNVFKNGFGNILALAALIAGMGWFFLGLRRNFKNVLAETRAGYATTKIIYSWGGGKTVRRATLPSSGRLGWDFGGVWFMKSDGTVISEPIRSKFAPGYYPSPNSIGSYELWTGMAWAGIFRSDVSLPSSSQL